MIMKFSEWKLMKEDIINDWKYIKEAETIWRWLFETEEGKKYVIKSYDTIKLTDKILKKIFNVSEKEKKQLLLFKIKDKKFINFILKIDYDNGGVGGIFEKSFYGLYITIYSSFLKNLIYNKFKLEYYKHTDDYKFSKTYLNFMRVFIHEYKHLINYNRFSDDMNYKKYHEYDPSKVSEKDVYEKSVLEYDSYFSDFVFMLDIELNKKFNKENYSNEKLDNEELSKIKNDLVKNFKTYDDFINNFVMKNIGVGSRNNILMKNFRKKTLKRLYPYYKKWKFVYYFDIFKKSGE